MAARSRSRRILVASTVTVVVLIVALVIVGLTSSGDESGRSIGRLEGIRDAAGNAAGMGHRLSPRARFHAAAAVIGGAWALVLTLASLRATRARWFWWPCAVLAWWILFELCVSPFLAVPLSLWTYGIKQKVDHRPTNQDGEFNADSLRGTADSAEFVAGGRNIVFLGDSFTFASGVDVDQSFVHRFETLWNEEHRERPVRAANFGWVSSSPLLDLRRLRDVGEKYHPALVVLCFDMTDFSDDLRYGNMLQGRGMYVLYDKLPITLKAFHALAPDTFLRVLPWSVGDMPGERFFASQHPLEATRKWMEPSFEHIQQIDAWCRERNAAFVLVVLPRCYQYDAREAPRSSERGEYATLGPYSLEPFRFFEEHKTSARFPIVSLLRDFQARTAFPTCFEEDPHWNAAGHEVAARALVRELGPFIPR